MLAPVSKGKIPPSPPARGAAAGRAPDNVECSGGGQNSGAAGKAEREISIFYKGGLAVLPAAQCKICGLICEKKYPEAAHGRKFARANGRAFEIFKKNDS